MRGRGVAVDEERTSRRAVPQHPVDSTESAPIPVKHGPSSATAAVQVQILATEHWSLLATRSLAWTEAFSRTNIFLTVLSAALVGLAFVRQAGSAEEFSTFALVLLPVVLFFGACYLPPARGNQHAEAQLVAGMNRLRHGYLDMAPELEPYFITAKYDDMSGLAQTLGLGDSYFRRLPLQV